MGIDLKKAKTIKEGLENLLQNQENAKVVLKGTENEVIASFRKATMEASMFKKIGELAYGHTITLARSGANVKLIIW